MAATLPPINGSAGKSRQANIQHQHFMPTPPKGPPGKLKPLSRKGPSSADRDVFKKHDVLRQNQPELTKHQTARYTFVLKCLLSP